MARKTLLQLTQNILSAMDSDEINGIYDTVEAVQVATIILETLEAEFNNIELPDFNRIVQLTSSSDITRPNTLRYNDDINGIQWLRYRDFRNNGLYRELYYMQPGDFFDRQLMYTSTGPHTELITDPSGVTYYIKNNSAPTYYTSIDNEYLIFDSYDKDYESTLEGVNTFAIGGNDLADGTLDDEYIPPIPSNLFPLLLAEAKATCFITLKQMPSPKSEQIARRQRSRMQSNLYKTKKENIPYARYKHDFSRNR